MHIHAKVHIGDSTVLTTQFFFDDAPNTSILAEPAYVAHGSSASGPRRPRRG